LFRRARLGFRGWRRTRPFWGGLIALLGGIEILLSERAPVAVVVHLGAQGLAGYVVPVVLVLCALLLWFNPAQRIFYSILAVLARSPRLLPRTSAGSCWECCWESWAARLPSPGCRASRPGRAGAAGRGRSPADHRRVWHLWSATANGRRLPHMAGTRRRDPLVTRSPGPAVACSRGPAVTCSLGVAVA
jgi:hypothetical protein